MIKSKTIHGHYSTFLEEEAKRIQKMYKEMLDYEISWTEATAIAGKRSLEAFWTTKKLKEALAELRGLHL